MTDEPLARARLWRELSGRDATDAELASATKSLGEELSGPSPLTAGWTLEQELLRALAAQLPRGPLEALEARALKPGAAPLADALAKAEPGWTWENAAAIVASSPAALEPLLRAARRASPKPDVSALLDLAKAALRSPEGAGLVVPLASLDPGWAQANAVAIVEADPSLLGSLLLALEPTGHALEAGLAVARAGLVQKNWAWKEGLDYVFRDRSVLAAMDREIVKAAKAPAKKGAKGSGDAALKLLKAAAGKESPGKVQYLYLSDASSLTTLEPLAEHFPKLETLSAFKLSPSLDLAPLAKLPSLRHLSVSWGTVDLAGLAACDQIESLSFDKRATPKHLEAIAGMKGLKSLHFGGKGLEKLDSFPKTLASLGLNGLVVKDLKFLSKLPGLTELSLGDARSLAKLDAIAKLTKLESLSFAQSQVKTLAPLAKLVKMKSLRVGENKKLSDLTGVEGMDGLEDLDANFCPVESVEPLAGKKKLERLLLRKSRVESIEPLAGCAALKFLFLEKSRLRSLAGVEKLPALETLWFWDTKVADLSPLRGLPHLKELDLSGLKKISDFSPLATLAKLETLDLFRTRFDDVALLAKRKSLKKVRLAGTPLKPADPDVKALSSALRHRGGVLSFDSRGRWR